MNNAAFRKAIALLLTMVMLTACMPVFATETANSGEEKTIDTDVKEEAVAPDDATALEVAATGDGDASMTVNGEASATAEASASEESADATGAVVEAENGNTATLNIEETLSAETSQDNSAAYGVIEKAREDSTVSVEAESIEATAAGEASSAEGVEISNAANGTASVKAEGISATAEEKGSYAEAVVFYELTEGGKAEVNTGKDGITATANGENGDALGVVGNVFGEATVTSEGDISAKSTSENGTQNSATAVGETIYKDGSFTMEAKGNVEASASGTGTSTGVSLTALDESSATVTVEKKISAETEADSSSAYAASVYAGENSTVSLKAETIEAATHGKNSTAESLVLRNEASSTISVKTEGISATDEGGGSYAEGVVFYELAEGGKVEVDAGTKGITATNNGENGDALAVVGHVFGDVTLDSEGSITAASTNEKGNDNQTIAIGTFVYDDSSLTIHTGGDVEATSKSKDNKATAVSSMVQGSESQETITVDGTISANGQGRTEAIVARSDEKAAGIRISAGEDIKAISTEGSATGIDAENHAGSTEISAGGSITATTEGGEVAIAVQAECTDGNVKVETGKNVTAENTGEYDAIAIDAEISGTGSLTVHVGGGVKATTAGETSRGTGVDLDMTGGNADIQIDGDVAADENGIKVVNHSTSSAVQDASPAADAKISVGGSIEVDVRGETWEDMSGINIRSENMNATTEVTVEGDVSAKAEGRTYAIEASAISGKIKVKTGGDISAISSEMHGAGLSASASAGGEVEMDAGGNVSFSSAEGGSGVDAVALHAGARIRITVAEGITAEATNDKEDVSGILVGNYVHDGASGEVDITAGGDVSSSGAGISTIGGKWDRQWLEGEATVKEEEFVRTEYEKDEFGDIEGYKLYYNAEEDYYYNEYGSKWRPEKAESGLTRIEVKGNVKGGNTGLDMDTKAISDIIVDGTLEGGNHAVVIADETMADNLTLTVWEIKPNEDGSVAEYGRLDENGELQTTEATDFEKKIQYIIRLDQPTAGATLSTEGTYDYEGYNVAHEDDTVVLRVDLEPGYEIMDAYNGTDTKVSLLKDADGNYYLVVPRGGAVLLSVTLKKAEAEVKTQTVRKSAQTVKVTINPNGGTLRGSAGTYTFTKQKGDWMTLPEAPVKEGATFLGWYRTTYPATDAGWNAPEEGSAELLQAGSKTEVTEDCCFTAVWKSAE